MMKRHGLVGLLALTLVSGGAIGCGGDEGDASISGVIPGEVFVGRSADVLIVGNNTNWSEGVSVNFGPGVTVGEITVASPTALMVNVTADSSAELGSRDVVVSSDGDELSFTGAFELTSPIRIASMQGQTAQGSIAVVKLQNLDFANPFDTTTTGDGFFTPLEYVNISVLAGAGADALIQSVEPYTIELLLLTDVTAEAGTQDLEVLSGPLAQEQSFRFPAAFEVQAREPVALSGATTGSIDQPFQSLLYTVSPSDLSIVSAYTYAESPDASAAFALLPASGSFAELISFGPQAQFVSDEPHYLVYWDGTGSTGYSFQIGADLAVVKAELTQTEPNDDIPGAQDAPELPAVLMNATIEDAEDQDWIRVTVTEADVGKSLHVFTFGHPYTDTALEVRRGNGDSITAEPIDQDFHESYVTPALTQPGEYFVKVFGSPGYFDPAYNTYSAAFQLVD